MHRYRGRARTFAIAALAASLMGVFAIPRSGAAVTTTTTAAASDAYVNSLYTGTNFSTQSTLVTTRNGFIVSRAFVSFVALPAGPYAGVTLRLHAVDAGDGVDVRTVTPFIGSTLNWTNQPPLGASIGSSGAVAAGQVVDIALNPAALTGSSLSLALEAKGRQVGTFASIESGTPPQLLLTRDGSATTTLPVTPTTLATAPATVGTAYDAALTVAGGASAAWQVTSGALPPGLTLNTGHITGVPSQAGAFTFSVTARLDDGSSGSRRYSMLVRPDDGGAYAARAASVIAAHADAPFPPMSGCTTDIGNLYYATAALWLNRDVFNANAKLTQVRMSHLLNNYCKSASPQNSLWLSMLVRPYYLYNSASSWFPARMSQAAQDNLVAQMWTFANQWSEAGDASDLWGFTGSENLDIQRRSFFLLAAQVFKSRPDYATRTYADGTTVLRQYNAWRMYWMNKLDDLAKKGLFAEVGNQSYHGYTLSTIVNLYNFAEDPIIRKKAEMVLDLDFADFAQNQLNHIWDTAKSRADADDNYDGRKDAMTAYADLLFGPANPRQNNHVLYFATSGYSPPDAVRSLVDNQNARGAYEYVTRRPGAGSGHLDMARSVLHYDYVTPEYVMAGAELNPTWAYATVSSMQRWQGVSFATSSDARVYPQAGTTAQNAMAYDNFFTVQHGGAMVTHKNARWSTLPTLVYFASSLDTVDEDSGWLFVKEGNAFLAVRPQVGGYTWLSANKNRDPNPDLRFIHVTNGASPIVFEAARASQFGGDFAAFKARVKAAARSYVGGVMRYTGTDGTTLTLADGTALPTVNGTAVNFAPAGVMSSPYVSSAWNSGRVTVAFGSHRATYDFSDTNNPKKTAS
jgi:putative Ig domain-containing protein